MEYIRYYLRLPFNIGIDRYSAVMTVILIAVIYFSYKVSIINSINFLAAFFYGISNYPPLSFSVIVMMLWGLPFLVNFSEFNEKNMENTRNEFKGLREDINRVKEKRRLEKEVHERRKKGNNTGTSVKILIVLQVIVATISLLGYVLSKYEGYEDKGYLIFKISFMSLMVLNIIIFWPWKKN